MSDDPSRDAPLNIAQELGADTRSGKASPSGRLRPLTMPEVVRDLTLAHPFAMLGLAFIAGAAYAGRHRWR